MCVFFFCVCVPAPISVDFGRNPVWNCLDGGSSSDSNEVNPSAPEEYLEQQHHHQSAGQVHDQDFDYHEYQPTKVHTTEAPKSPLSYDEKKNTKTTSSSSSSSSHSRQKSRSQSRKRGRVPFSRVRTTERIPSTTARSTTETTIARATAITTTRAATTVPHRRHRLPSYSSYDEDGFYEGGAPFSGGGGSDDFGPTTTDQERNGQDGDWWIPNIECQDAKEGGPLYFQIGPAGMHRGNQGMYVNIPGEPEILRKQVYMPLTPKLFVT